MISPQHCAGGLFHVGLRHESLPKPQGPSLLQTLLRLLSLGNPAGRVFRGGSHLHPCGDLDPWATGQRDGNGVPALGSRRRQRNHCGTHRGLATDFPNLLDIPEKVCYSIHMSTSRQRKQGTVTGNSSVTGNFGLRAGEKD